MARILIVDDERRLRVMLAHLFETQGHETVLAADGAEALQRLEETRPDVVISDIRMPGLDGLALLRETRARMPEVEVILMTAHHTDVQSAVEAVKAGAYDYLAKPFSNDELLVKVERLLEEAARKRELTVLRAQLRREAMTFDRMVSSPDGAMARVVELAKKVAPTDASVLLRGESGTGKEVLAQAIHNASRPNRPFVAVNCGALAETLLESELFGHEKGAFTGAHARKIGLMESARGGTLFLDEVGEMPPALQVKLLRALETRTVVRVGGTAPIEVSFRVIAATNRDLEAAIAEGVFREDLFYRLSVFPIEIPPLRRRTEEIIPLADHFLRRFGRTAGDLTPAARERLERYRWPGNVRELANVIERASILAGDGPIDESCLPDHVGPGPAPQFALEIPEEGIRLRDVECDLIRQALRKTGGNKSRAAALLGITRRTLYSKLERFEELRDLR